ncbi:28842_t:CDS:2, partial [Dentiscutata erythropus]
YRVAAYFGGHKLVLEYQSPNKKYFPVAYFTSGAGCQTSKKACKGHDWIAPRGTLGFLHASSNESNFEKEFEELTNYIFVLSV